MPKVSVIIVCMNRPDLLFPCLDSLQSGTAADTEYLVVAYLFNEENLALLRSRYPWVSVIVSDSIRGFSENNNLALRQASGEFCLIINDDTLPAPGLIDSLLDDFRSLGDDAAAVSPKIVFPDGKVQTLGRAPWTMWRYMKHYLHLVDETVPGPWTMKEGLFQTWTLNGACFLAKTAPFREAGWFDERFVFTPEDIALGHRFNDMGYTVWADSRVSLTHLAGGTVSPMERVIKPARVKGALEFYSSGSPVKRFMLASYIWTVESLRKVKYLFRDHPDPTSRNAIMLDTAENVAGCVFSSLTPRETFLSLMEKYKG